MNPFVVESPAKLNLFLAVTGRRPDGFHDLVSLVAPLAWGDTLHVTPAAELTMACEVPGVPIDETNLIMKAARAFQAATGWRGGAHFRLEKRIPVGAGMGGGSSNAAAALWALDQLTGNRLAREDLVGLAASVGSDCALFLQPGPVVIRGRGDRVEGASSWITRRLQGRRVLVFKPTFGIGTPWAYQQLAAGGPDSYLTPTAAEARLAAWSEDPASPAEALLFNNLEGPAFAKFVALPTLLANLRRDFALAPRMTGSGSACFALLPQDLAPEILGRIFAAIRDAWGRDAFVIETRLAG